SQVSAEGPMPPMHTSVPPLQVRTPVSQSPMPVPQAPPPPGFPSSGVPLQSLSSPSQISGEGPIAPTHVPSHAGPIEQVSTPGRHWPTSLPHGRVMPSMTPSPLLSRPSPTSGVGPVPVHAPHTPATQVSVPAEQSPRSVPQVRTSPSSTSPSQSSSAPLHVSGRHVVQTLPSSIGPSQSSSTPLQMSAGGVPQVPQALRR